MRSHRTLAILTIVAVLSYLWANNARVQITAPHFEEKLAAARWMKAALDTLRAAQYARGVFPDKINDPNLTALIGERYTLITTDTGDLDAKATALNPNMAAVMVEYLLEAGLKKGDVIAVGMTGSLPGMNLALLAACETLGIIPLVITSVGSSSWGANDPNFTWIDMESRLESAGLLHNRSFAASIGGGEDVGRRLSPAGRELIRIDIRRNGLELIEENTLEESVARRMALFEEKAAGRPIKLYVNIGGGLASIGHSRNTLLIPTGLNTQLPVLNYPRRGVIHRFADRGVPVLQVSNIVKIAAAFDLPRTPNPLPEPGVGSLFREVRYNLLVATLALAIVVLTLVAVLYFDRRAQRLDRPGVDPDTLI